MVTRWKSARARHSNGKIFLKQTKVNRSCQRWSSRRLSPWQAASNESFLPNRDPKTPFPSQYRNSRCLQQTNGWNTIQNIQCIQLCCCGIHTKNAVIERVSSYSKKLLPTWPKKCRSCKKIPQKPKDCQCTSKKTTKLECNRRKLKHQNSFVSKLATNVFNMQVNNKRMWIHST